jgi:hypothetical protein
MIVDALRYVPNSVIRRDVQTPAIKEEIQRYSSQYSAHPNGLVVNPLEPPDNRRLRRHLPNDLPTRFLVQLSYLLKKKSASAALNTAVASVHTQMT